MTAPSILSRRGYLYVILGAVLWGISGTVGKFLFEKGVTAFQLVQVRVTLASLLLCLWFCFRPSLARIRPGDIFYFVILGTVGMAMVQFTYFFAISKIQVAVAILLQYLAPVLITLYLVIFDHEKLSLLVAVAIASALAGCYLMAGAYNFNFLHLNQVGLISGVCSALSFAFYSLYGERGMRLYNPWTVLGYALFFAALFWNLAHFLWRPAPAPLAALMHPYSPVEWVGIAYITVLGTLVPFGLYFEGVSLIRSSRASVTATLEPITGGIAAYLFLGEALQPLQVLGGLLVIAAVVILQTRQEHDDKAPALIRMRSHTAAVSSLVAEDGSEDLSAN